MTDLVVRPSFKGVKSLYILSVLLAIAILVASRSLEKDLKVLYVVPAILFLWTAIRHFSLSFTKLTVTDGKLRYETGAVSRSTRALELAKIQDVRVDQSIGGRILGIGHLTLETAGEAGRLVMENIDHPQQTADRILELARKRPA